jgi:hypothetical protein
MPEFLLTKRKNNNNYSFNYPTPSLLRPVLSVVFDYYFTLQYIIYSIPSYVNAVFIFSGEEVVQRPLYILPVHACEQQMRPRVLCMWRTHGLNHCFHFIFFSFFFTINQTTKTRKHSTHNLMYQLPSLCKDRSDNSINFLSRALSLSVSNLSDSKRTHTP